MSNTIEMLDDDVAVYRDTVDASTSTGTGIASLGLASGCPCGWRYTYPPFDSPAHAKFPLRWALGMSLGRGDAGDKLRVCGAVLWE